MKTTTVTTYQCELCGWRSTIQKEVVACEKNCAKLSKTLITLFPVGTFLLRDGRHLSMVTGRVCPAEESKGRWLIRLDLVRSEYDMSFYFSSSDTAYTDRAFSELKVLSDQEVLGYLKSKT